MSVACVIFDIDGTLADCSHRKHFLEETPKNWEGFLDSKLVILDKPIEPIVRLARQLRNFNYLIACTGRNERHRAVTQQWLNRHDLNMCKLLMRANEDFRPDEIVKEEMLRQLQSEGYAPWLVIDDRKRVVDMWRRNGLVCLQAADGDF